MDGAPPCCGPPPGDAGGVYAHLVSMKLLDKPANEYASRLIEDGYDTPEAVDELSLEELSEDLGFKKGHLKAVERWRGGGGGRSVADGAESAAAQELRAANEALKAEKDAMELAHRKEKAEADEMLKRLTKELGDAVDSDEAREAQLQESQAEVAQLKSQLAASTTENLESDLRKATEETGQHAQEADAAQLSPGVDSRSTSPSSIDGTHSVPSLSRSAPTPVDVASPEDAMVLADSNAAQPMKIFFSLRFGAEHGVVPMAEALRAALAERGVTAQIVNMTAGGDIDSEVFSGIESCGTFLVFGSAKYGEDTGNTACTYYEYKHAMDRKKRIILLRMIAFDADFDELQARVIFGANRLVVPWMTGTAMPADLPDTIIDAMTQTQAASTSNVAAPLPTAPEPEPAPQSLGEIAAACGATVDDLLGFTREDLTELLTSMGVAVVARNRMLQLVDAEAAGRLEALCTSGDEREVGAALRTLARLKETAAYRKLVAYSADELPFKLRMRPFVEALRTVPNFAV